MTSDINRDLGEQPIAKILAAHRLNSHALVEASPSQITHKMVARAVKGRRLTPNIQRKILEALNNATGKDYKLGDIFNY